MKSWEVQPDRGALPVFRRWGKLCGWEAIFWGKLRYTIIYIVWGVPGRDFEDLILQYEKGYYLYVGDGVDALGMWAGEL